MAMDRVYVGPTEPKGPKKPALWIKNDSVDGMAIFINVGNSYVKYGQQNTNNDKLLVTIDYSGGDSFSHDKSIDEVLDAINSGKTVEFVINDTSQEAIYDKVYTTNYSTAINEDPDLGDLYKVIEVVIVNKPMGSNSVTLRSFIFGRGDIDGQIVDIATYNSNTIYQPYGCWSGAIDVNMFADGCISVNVDNDTITINENNQLCINQ